jgi:hypothetical protein
VKTAVRVRRSSRYRSLVLCVAAWLIAGCDYAPRRTRTVTRADTVSIDRERCLLPPGLSPGDEAAVRCAELYVARNGYTDLPPVPDSTQWVGEFLDLGMEYRRNTLKRRALAVCRGDQIQYIVIFPHTTGEPVRGVALADEPGPRPAMYVRVMHQDPAHPSDPMLAGRCVLQHAEAEP